MRRLGVVTAGLVLLAVGAAGLTGCAGRRAPAQGPVEAGVATEAEMQALTALGFSPADMQPVSALDPSPNPSAGPREQGKRDRQKRPRLRPFLRNNTLHGEIVVRADDGTRTIAVQRGTVTAVDDKTMTVKSMDGFTLTWTFGDQLRVIERRTTVQPDDVKVGTEVGVAGVKNGDAAMARLIVIPRAK